MHISRLGKALRESGQVPLYRNFPGRGEPVRGEKKHLIHKTNQVLLLKSSFQMSSFSTLE